MLFLLKTGILSYLFDLIDLYLINLLISLFLCHANSLMTLCTPVSPTECNFLWLPRPITTWLASKNKTRLNHGSGGWKPHVKVSAGTLSSQRLQGRVPPASSLFSDPGSPWACSHITPTSAVVLTWLLLRLSNLYFPPSHKTASVTFRSSMVSTSQDLLLNYIFKDSFSK